MPYVNIRVTQEGVTRQQKEALVRRVTDLVAEVLGKEDPTTVVVIDEVPTTNWGIRGRLVADLRAERANNQTKKAEVTP